jgi:hypothetical protein
LPKFLPSFCFPPFRYFFLLFAYVSFASGKNKGRKKLPFGDEISPCGRPKENEKVPFGEGKKKKEITLFCFPSFLFPTFRLFPFFSSPKGRKNVVFLPKENEKVVKQVKH